MEKPDRAELRKLTRLLRDEAAERLEVLGRARAAEVALAVCGDNRELVAKLGYELAVRWATGIVARALKRSSRKAGGDGAGKQMDLPGIDAGVLRDLPMSYYVPAEDPIAEAEADVEDREEGAPGEYVSIHWLKYEQAERAYAYLTAGIARDRRRAGALRELMEAAQNGGDIDKTKRLFDLLSSLKV